MLTDLIDERAALMVEVKLEGLMEKIIPTVTAKLTKNLERWMHERLSGCNKCQKVEDAKTADSWISTLQELVE